jgi:hypothetical protein
MQSNSPNSPLKTSSLSCEVCIFSLMCSLNNDNIRNLNNETN